MAPPPSQDAAQLPFSSARSADLGTPENQSHSGSFVAENGGARSEQAPRDESAGEIETAASHVQADSAGEVLTAMSHRYRKRGKTGPDCCLAPASESAIARAIAAAANQEVTDIFFPHTGTTFSSYEEAKEFYNLYSWEVGFGVREARPKKNSNGYITSKDIVCSCQGFSENPKGASSRTGCKVMVRLHRTADHGWIISSAHTEHNHPLSNTCGQKKQWGSHGGIDAVTKEFIRKLRRNNVSLGRVCSIVGVNSEDSLLHISSECVRRLCAKTAQEDIKDDIEKTIQLLRVMQNADPELEIRVMTDDKGQIEAMLWCTGKNQRDYKLFGDVVTFDTTYRTNLYNLPFGVFIGANNHYQSIVFGGVLLSHERTQDFEWTFKNFAEIMGGKKPDTILTDQAMAMAAALKTTWPGSRHRWCRWHILRNAKQKIGPQYSKKSGFKKKFNMLITHETSPAEFERRWHELVREYNLVENKFLNRAFEHRGMWAKPYFMGVFCAAMTSTQRSESANHMLKRFIPRAAPMHLFVARFKEFQFNRNQAEERQDYMTKQVSRRKRIGVPIEMHAQNIYTREICERFADELYESGAFLIDHKSDDGLHFDLVHMNCIPHEDKLHFKVHLPSFHRITCSCGMFEHSGLLCRHSLKVLVHLDRTQIPSENIKHRWTIAATSTTIQQEKPTTLERKLARNTELKKRVLLAHAMELSEDNAPVDDGALNAALRAIENIRRSKPSNAAADNTSASNEPIHGAPTSSSMSFACPPRPKRAGRPTDNSRKTWKKQKKLEKNYHTDEQNQNESNDTSNQEQNERRTRRLSDLLQVTRRT